MNVRSEPLRTRSRWQVGRLLSVIGRIALAVALVGLTVERAPAGEKPARPNIIYIMVDDLGYGDLGCYGQKRIQTPNLDRMAREGMRFTSYYAGNTVCRPSRLSLWTGLHCGHTPISSNAGYTLQDSDNTVPEVLKRAGYATGGVGKWACGTPGSGGEPIHHGFDFWLGYLDQGNAHNYYPTHLWRCDAGGCEKVELPGNVLMDDPRARGRVAHPDHRETYSHNVMTDAAVRFIREHHQRPFLLHVHWTIPHANNEGGRVTGNGQEVPDYGIYAEKDWPDVEKGFAAMVTLMDADCRRIFDLIEKLGIEKRTLVFFTSDNGPHNEGGHRHTFFDSNGPLRGLKRDLYEGGIRVPGIAWWPGVIQPGTTTDEPLAFYDFLATACDLAGVKPPENTDGVSFAPTLLGEPSEQKRHEYLFFKFGSRSMAARAGKWKVVSFPEEKYELYNLSIDAGEENDLKKTHPDVLSRMKGILEKATR